MKNLPPKAKKIPTTKIYHNHQLDDDYVWLRDDNWQKVMDDPSVLKMPIREWLMAENDYHTAFLSKNQTLVDNLFNEIKSRISEDDSDVPLPDGDYAYYRKFITGGQYPLFCRLKLQGHIEQVLLDGNKHAALNDFFRIIQTMHSPDHTLFAYSVDVMGAEKYDIRLLDIKTGQHLVEQLPGAHGDFVFSNCSNYIFYTVIDDSHRPSMVKRHKIGDDPDLDTTVFEEHDPGFFVGISKTESGRFIVISCHDHQTSEAHVIDANAPLISPRLIEARHPGIEYEISDSDDRFLILTNADGAFDYKIMVVPITDPIRRNWRECVAHKPGRLILSLLTFKNYFVYQMREHGLPQIIITDTSSHVQHAINFDDPAYSLGLSGSYEFDTPILRFTYSSPRTPMETYDYHMHSRSRQLKKQQFVPSGHDKNDYNVQKINVPARDGEQIPVTLLSLKNSSNTAKPVLLYGYGAYGMSIPAAFSTSRLSLVNRGFTYAIAHVRGGRDKGDTWYRQGRDLHKSNTFNDFIDVAEHLKQQNIAGTAGIAAHGGSAGGMLMGVIANQRPDLFEAIVADVPFVDVLNTMLDDTLPLTPPEWPEWGNPITDKAAFERILSYSPYDNVCAQNYPAMYITAGLTDPRVTYWEPAKWVAKLRDFKTDDHPLYFKTNMQAGHAGASGRFDSLRETAEIYGFLIRAMGQIK